MDAKAFYDDLSVDYHLLFPDWWEAAGWHGAVVAGVLAGAGVEPPATVLDCTCGIGTQALPLAALGFDVTGTDVSTAMVERAAAEASARGIGLELAVADVRALAGRFERLFDAVISLDNALPHLRTDDELSAALAGVASCLVPGGLLVASIRDYDALRVDAPPGVPVAVHGPPGARHASGQAWTWTDDREHVQITLFTLEESDRGWRGSSRDTTYRALTRAQLAYALDDAGFEHVTWLEPAETGYYQPMVTARRRP